MKDGQLTIGELARRTGMPAMNVNCLVEAEKFGVQHSMEAAGHTSSNYIWRYIKPSNEEKEKALEDLF